MCLTNNWIVVSPSLPAQVSTKIALPPSLTLTDPPSLPHRRAALLHNSPLVPPFIHSLDYYSHMGIHMCIYPYTLKTFIVCINQIKKLRKTKKHFKHCLVLPTHYPMQHYQTLPYSSS